VILGVVGRLICALFLSWLGYMAWMLASNKYFTIVGGKTQSLTFSDPCR
jgi:hypothetical protein